jgi:GntR family transcriptional regulator/MocR family aminotransferase
MVKRAGGALLLSIKIDRAAHQPVSTQLCIALRDLILGGGFLPGERLPASRTLARDLGLSRTTIIEVFDRLVAEGLVESHTGAGTFVSEALAAQRPLPPQPDRPARLQSAPRLSTVMAQAVQRFGERQRLPHAPRAFTTALPAFDAFPMAQWARLSAKYLRGGRDEIMGYGDPDGAPALRRALAAHLRANRGIACDPEQLFIVGGAQQAFHLIGSTLLNPGDKVWFENPGAIGARNSLIASGADLVPIPVDAEGLRVEDGLLRAPRFRLAFVTPSHQQPLGCVMSLERRFALLHAAERAGAWVVEDDYDGEFFFGGRPHTQAVVAAFIDEGHFSAHVRRMRQLYLERHDTMVAACHGRLGGLLEIVPTHGGLHTIARLPAGVPELLVSQAADARGVTASPIGRFAIEPVPDNGLVLGFGGVGAKVIEAGVAVLAQVLERRVNADRDGRMRRNPASVVTP